MCYHPLQHFCQPTWMNRQYLSSRVTWSTNEQVSLLLSLQITKDESSTVILPRPTPRLLRLVWLEEGCASFFSICRSIPCRCTFQQLRRSSRRVVAHAGMASGNPNHIHGSWKAFHGHQHNILQNWEKSPKDLAKRILCILSIFILKYLPIFI